MLDAIAAPQSRRDRFVLIAALSLISLLCLRSIVTYLHATPWATMFDFQSFYCGGWALMHHANPYLNQPLHDCEAALNPRFFSVVHNVTIPAPLPPYALLAFVPIAYVFAWHGACVIWESGLFIAAVVSAYAVSRFSRIPLYICLVAMMPAIIFPSDVAGALAPYPIAVWMLATWTNTRRPWLTATLLGVGMIEPHLGLAACLAAFLAWKTVRWRLLIVGAVIAGLQTIFTDPHLIPSYIGMMHLHARSEVSGAAQHSLTFLLANLGVAPAPALQAGFIQYALLVCAGIGIGIWLARRRNEAEWVLLVPLACSVVGGPFVHLTEIAVAIPLCLLMVVRLRSQLAALAALLLATPWYSVHAQLPFLPFVLITTGVLIWAFWRPRTIIIVLGALAGGVVLVTISPVLSEPLGIAKSIVDGLPKIPAPPPTAYASTTWQAYNDLFLHNSWWLISRSPTWFAMVLMLGALLVAVRAGIRERSEGRGGIVGDRDALEATSNDGGDDRTI